MKTQHTPGPWKTGDADWRIIVGPHTRFKNGRLSGVAAVDESDDLSEDISNARLIAAAPQMLEALRALMQQAVKDAEHYAPDGNEPIWAFIMDASDAIAKATRGAK